MDRFELSYRPDFRLLMHAGLALGRHRYAGAKGRRLKLINGGAFAIGSFVLAVGMSLASRALPPLQATAVTTGVIVVLIIAYRALVYPLTLRIAGEIINADYRGGTMRVVLDESGLRWDDDALGVHLRWSGIEKIFAIPKAIVFMCGGMGLLVPLDAFKSASERQEFLRASLDRLSPEAASASRNDRALAALL